MIYVILFIITLIGDNIGQIIYENMGDDKSTDAMKTCYKEFHSKLVSLVIKHILLHEQGWPYLIMNLKLYVYKIRLKGRYVYKKLFVLFTERELFLENQVNKLTKEVQSIKGI